MNENLNLVEILKDCPKGTKLYSPAFGECALEGVESDTEYPIKVIYKLINNNTSFDYFTKNGYLVSNILNVECMLFPSKDQRDWSKWHRPVVDGEVVMCGEDQFAIFKQHIKHLENGGELIRYYVYYDAGECDLDTIDGQCWMQRLATEEEKATLFQAIKDKGYKWNNKTKTLEKLIEPKFKVGDRIKHRLTGEVYMVLFVLSNGCGGGVYDVAITNEIRKSIDVKEQDYYELVPSKFDISTLIPYESKVLIRSTIGGYWQPAFWGAYIIDTSDGLHHHDYLTTRGFTPYCIPYDGNEHLIGKIDDCCDFYKTWEE